MSKRKRPQSIDGQFAPRLIEMLESPAYRALSPSARYVLDRIEIELAHHGGRDNGDLPVTYDDFEHYGIHRRCVAPAIRELVALKFIEITKPGRAGNAEHRAPNLFRLTYRHAKREAPTHDWRRITTTEQATALARQARAPIARKKHFPVAVFAKPSGRNCHRNHSGKTATTGHSGKTATTLDISGWVLPGGAPVSEASPEVTTSTLGRTGDRVEVVHDRERCYGYLRPWGTGFKAWWSGDRFDDHYIGEFATKPAAISAVVDKARAGRC
ncbi:MAG: hypothetical protein AUI16_20885 [Alphaproteobacteria bacterium 13_2_20CM_2_64_7]|jgi:hypothetical protein|nr:MAG: hypothetical protein AUI16_20885 [Alphaproteobacteria bacterium 13_2_20CM_2_64_7]